MSPPTSDHGFIPYYRKYHQRFNEEHVGLILYPASALRPTQLAPNVMEYVVIQVLLGSVPDW